MFNQSEELSQTTPNIGAALKYNPHLWSAKELKAIFVARKKELQQIIKRISEIEATTVPQHILITGYRGMGKSTLLQRVALAVEEDSELSKTWLALRFPEEQYTVSTLEEVWKNVLGSLADALDENGELQHGIDAFLDELEQHPKAEREKQALEFLQQWCDLYQCRLILLMDSSDLLLANLSHSGSSKKVNAGATQLWRLRDTLQNDPRFFWLGGSYQPLEAEALYHDTFLDFFYNIELKPLTLKEMRTTMQELARVFGLGRGLVGEQAVAEITRSFEQHPERLKTLHRLTGGNVRTTVTLYELFSAGGENQVQADLKRLLDLMTPLYKHRLESLADQLRKILAHIFEHWAPISLADLALISGLEKSSVSPQLLRLEQEGLIEKTPLPATKRKGYQVTERFFNIWYLMRNAPRRLRMRLGYLVQFMRLWYSSEELTQLAIHQRKKHRNSQSLQLEDYEYSRALATTLSEKNVLKHQLEWTVFKQMREQLQQQLPDLFDFQGDDKPFATSSDYLKRLEALPEKLRLCCLDLTEKQLSLWVSRVMSAISLSLEEKERIASSANFICQSKFDKLNKVFIEETNKFSNQYGHEACEIVQTAINQCDFFPECPDSKLAYSQTVNCFSENVNAFEFALDLFEKRYQDQNVEKAYRYLIRLDSDQAYLWNNLGNLLKNHLKSFEEAEQAYRQAIALDSEFAYPWNGLGNLLQENLKRYEEAEQAYHQAIVLDSEFACPWNGLGNLLKNYQKRYEESEQAFRQAIALDSEYACPWNGLGNLLKNHQKRYEESEQAFRQAIALDSEYAYPWNGLGNLYQDYLHQYEDAELALRKSIELDNVDPYAYSNLARVLLRQNKNTKEVIFFYQKTIESSAEDDDDFTPLLQAHLFLDHRDLAVQTINKLSEQGNIGDAFAFYQIKEQCAECHQIGLGAQLSDVMLKSNYAPFLQPFILALQSATGDDNALLAAPVEIADMAREVLLAINEITE